MNPELEKAIILASQKELGDLDKVLEEFDKELPCVNHGCDNDGVVMGYDKNGDPEQQQCEYCYRERLPIKDFIRTHWPKPDPRFVEVGKIVWPKEGHCYRHDKNEPLCLLCNTFTATNQAIDACKAAVEAVGIKEK